MNTCVRAVVLGLAVLGVSACTGMQQKSDAAFVPQPVAPSMLDDDELYAARYVARVEQIARRRGIGVVWVNAPRRPDASKAEQQ